jgi:hypothetical protein
MVAAASRNCWESTEISQACRLRFGSPKSNDQSALICGGLYHATQRLAMKSEVAVRDRRSARKAGEPSKAQGEANASERNPGMLIHSNIQSPQRG